MAVTIQKLARRYYLHGIPDDFAPVVREARCHWDPGEKAWWTGRRVRAEQVRAQAQDHLDRQRPWSAFTDRGEDPDTGPGIWFQTVRIRFWIDEEVLAWVDEWLAMLWVLEVVLTEKIELAIHHRRHLDTIWARQNEDQPRYPGNPYDFRAYTSNNRATLFVDETETAESTLFVLLHEIAHIALRETPYLKDAFLIHQLDFEWGDDDAHERDPEERMCNWVASAWLPRLGRAQPTIFYDRYWWRTRVNARNHATANLSRSAIALMAPSSGLVGPQRDR